MLPMLLRTLAALPLACAIIHRGLYDSKDSLERRQDQPAYQAHTIEVPIDHFPDNPRYAPHTNATFSQRYYFDSSYYKPGGPVFLYIGGETSKKIV
ncbi:MAG: hypothetical protein L6R41_005066 [Letrouitia leprolyta]|nr:MAG: hypothetical protein L6R41_005066 [Letrouitia leprolyta]